MNNATHQLIARGEGTMNASRAPTRLTGPNKSISRPRVGAGLVSCRCLPRIVAGGHSDGRGSKKYLETTGVAGLLSVIGRQPSPTSLRRDQVLTVEKRLTDGVSKSSVWLTASCIPLSNLSLVFTSKSWQKATAQSQAFGQKTRLRKHCSTFRRDSLGRYQRRSTKKRFT